MSSEGQACARCGADNPEGATFCHACKQPTEGATLLGAKDSPDAAPSVDVVVEPVERAEPFHALDGTPAPQGAPSAADRARTADRAVSLLATWTKDDAGKADPWLTLHAVDVARQIHAAAGLSPDELATAKLDALRPDPEAPPTKYADLDGNARPAATFTNGNDKLPPVLAPPAAAAPETSPSPVSESHEAL